MPTQLTIIVDSTSNDSFETSILLSNIVQNVTTSFEMAGFSISTVINFKCSSSFGGLNISPHFNSKQHILPKKKALDLAQMISSTIQTDSNPVFISLNPKAWLASSFSMQYIDQYTPLLVCPIINEANHRVNHSIIPSESFFKLPTGCEASVRDSINERTNFVINDHVISSYNVLLFDDKTGWSLGQPKRSHNYLVFPNKDYKHQSVIAIPTHTTTSQILAA